MKKWHPRPRETEKRDLLDPVEGGAYVFSIRFLLTRSHIIEALALCILYTIVDSVPGHLVHEMQFVKS